MTGSRTDLTPAALAAPDLFERAKLAQDALPSPGRGDAAVPRPKHRQGTLAQIGPGRATPRDTKPVSDGSHDVSSGAGVPDPVDPAAGQVSPVDARPAAIGGSGPTALSQRSDTLAERAAGMDEPAGHVGRPEARGILPGEPSGASDRPGTSEQAAFEATMPRLEPVVSVGDRLVLDAVAQPVFVLAPDPDGVPRFAFFNRAAIEQGGVALTEAIGRTAADVFPGLPGQVAFAQHCQALTSGESATYEVSLPLRGETMRVRTTLVPEGGPDGTVRRVIGSSHVIETVQKTHQPVDAEEVRLTAIQDFITLAAHDLRTPMGQIRQLTDLVLEDRAGLKPGTIEMVDLIGQVTDRTQDLVTDVLAYANAIEISETPSDVAFDALVYDVMSMLDPQGSTKCGVTPGTIRAEARAVQIALRNLLDNALKHGRAHNAGPCALWVTLHDLGPELFGFSVRDDGNGFADSAMMFLETGQFRVESGFGLLGVRRLVESRGGSISASNDPETGGAVVKVILPGTVLAEPLL